MNSVNTDQIDFSAFKSEEWSALIKKKHELLLEYFSCTSGNCLYDTSGTLYMIDNTVVLSK